MRLGLLLIAILGVIGCPTAGTQSAGACALKVGMDTDALTECGCVPADTQGNYNAPMSSSALSGAVTRVSILNYMCPLGSAEFAKVVVVNGVAEEIFY